MCPFLFGIFRFGNNLIKFKFLIFFCGPFPTVGHLTPGLYEAEKFAGSGKKKNYPNCSRGTVFRANPKNVISLCIKNIYFTE